jgi:DNA (cytosine-5)-methyltransferase 1
MASPVIISLFAGAGGLDYGFEAAGFETAVALERDPACVETLRANRRWTVLAADIHEISSEQILAARGLDREQVDAVIGGPPCQPWRP